MDGEKGRGGGDQEERRTGSCDSCQDSDTLPDNVSALIKRALAQVLFGDMRTTILAINQFTLGNTIPGTTLGSGIGWTFLKFAHLWILHHYYRQVSGGGLQQPQSSQNRCTPGSGSGAGGNSSSEASPTGPPEPIVTENTFIFQR